MPRRFVLQLVEGEPPPKQITLAGVPSSMPVWRCSTCMVRQIVKWDSGLKRPRGKGCSRYTGSCNGEWIPDNDLASNVDAELGFDPTPTLEMNRKQITAAAVIDGAIIGGQWLRLTTSCISHITQAVSSALKQEFRVKNFYTDARWDFGFDEMEHVMTVQFWFPEPGRTPELKPDFVVRYRWFQ